MEAEKIGQIRFSVPGNPFGKQRPKFARQGQFVRTYTPKETLQHEKVVAALYEKVAKGKRFEDKVPLDIQITPFHKRHQRKSEKKCWNTEYAQ